MLPYLVMAVLLASPFENPRLDYVIAELVRSGYTRQEAEALFRDPRLQAYPPQRVQPRKIEWDRLIAQLVSPESVSRGRQFLLAHRETLLRAEGQFGVDKEVLAAILRIESNFGQNLGRYLVFNVFYTFLGSPEEKRWRWAADNLVSLAVYCKTTGTDCFRLQGSSAGALGPAQFLPRSLEAFGHDGNGDQIVNPFDTEDAIFSAANFLLQHGWTEEQAKALGAYYGSSVGYPRAVSSYAEALQRTDAP